MTQSKCVRGLLYSGEGRRNELVSGYKEPLKHSSPDDTWVGFFFIEASNPLMGFFTHETHAMGAGVTLLPNQEGSEWNGHDKNVS